MPEAHHLLELGRMQMFESVFEHDCILSTKKEAKTDIPLEKLTESQIDFRKYISNFKMIFSQTLVQPLILNSVHSAFVILPLPSGIEAML